MHILYLQYLQTLYLIFYSQYALILWSRSTLNNSTKHPLWKSLLKSSLLEDTNQRHSKTCWHLKGKSTPFLLFFFTQRNRDAAFILNTYLSSIFLSISILPIFENPNPLLSQIVNTNWNDLSNCILKSQICSFSRFNDYIRKLFV